MQLRFLMLGVGTLVIALFFAVLIHCGGATKPVTCPETSFLDHDRQNVCLDFCFANGHAAVLLDTAHCLCSEGFECVW